MSKRTPWFVLFLTAALITAGALSAQQPPTDAPAAQTTQETVPHPKLHAATNGTTGTIAKFDPQGTNGLNDSVMTESGGQIGVGTTPAAKLHVNGTILANQRIFSRLASSDTINSGSGLYLGESSGLDYAAIQLNAGHGIDFWTQPFGWGVGMRLTQGGFLGIGTTGNPTSRLQVEGNVALANMYNSIGSGNQRYIGIPGSNPGTFSGSGAYIGFTQGGTAGLSNDIRFYTHQSSVSYGERMRIDEAGNLGLGTTAPQALLHVKGDVNSSSVLRVENVNAGTSAYAALQFTINGNTNPTGAVFQNGTNNTAYAGAGSVNVGTFGSYPVSLITQNTPRLFVFPNGNVGIGVPQTAPLYTTPFEVASQAVVYGTSQARDLMRLYDTTATLGDNGGGIGFGAKYNTAGNYTEFANIRGVKANTISPDTTGKLVLSVSNSAGSVPDVVTLTAGLMAVNGNISANGSITGATVVNAVYQDVAEWVPATTHMTAGTVVVLNREHENEVMPSHRSYDTAVAGVVSARPGILLGIGSDSKAQVATTGRVKVHVDATAAAIAIGDLLVTSDKPGTAMKSQPVDLGGVQFHRPGTVIGKALEPLPNGEGDILVLLSLQ